MFCRNCGRKTAEEYCTYCRNNENINPDFTDYEKNDLRIYSNRSWFFAGILQIFLGAFGIGRFYLGYIKLGILQILVSLFTFGFGGFLWGVADGIMILAGKEKYDSKGRFLI